MAPTPPAKIGAKSLKNGAVTNKKIRNGAVSNRKIRRGAVSASKLRNGAVTAGKIGGGTVGAAELAPGERGEGFVATRSTQIPLPAGTATTVASLNLPPGSFIVTAGTSLGGKNASLNFIDCHLRDDGAVLTTGSSSVDTATFMDTVTLTGTSNGGVLALTCTPGADAVAKSRTITATRVGVVQAQ